MINWDFSKVNLSLCISILALVVAFTGQSRPYSYADERLEPQIVIINSFKGLLYASCSTEIANVKDCKMFYENLYQPEVDSFAKEIAAERFNLTPEKFWKYRFQLMEFEMEGKAMVRQLDDPELHEVMNEAVDAVSDLYMLIQEK